MKKYFLGTIGAMDEAKGISEGANNSLFQRKSRGIHAAIATARLLPTVVSIVIIIHDDTTV